MLTNKLVWIVVILAGVAFFAYSGDDEITDEEDRMFTALVFQQMFIDKCKGEQRCETQVQQNIDQCAHHFGHIRLADSMTQENVDADYVRQLNAKLEGALRPTAACMKNRTGYDFKL